MLLFVLVIAVLALAMPLVILLVRVVYALAKVAWGLLQLSACLTVMLAIVVGAVAFAAHWGLGAIVRTLSRAFTACRNKALGSQAEQISALCHGFYSPKLPFNPDYTNSYTSCLAAS